MYIEPTPPWEENMEKSNFRKSDEYRKDESISLAVEQSFHFVWKLVHAGIPTIRGTQMCMSLNFKGSQNRALRKRVDDIARR